LLTRAIEVDFHVRIEVTERRGRARLREQPRLASAELDLVALVLAGARPDRDGGRIELQIRHAADTRARVAEHCVELDVAAERHRRAGARQLERAFRRA